MFHLLAAVMLRLVRNLCLLLFTTLAHASLVREIAPADFTQLLSGKWLIYFALTGCKHCERLESMIKSIVEHPQASEQLLDVKFGRVNATVHNGLARTFSVKRFPTVLLLDDGGFYEYEGRREPKRLFAFAKASPAVLGGARRMPTELQENVSEWWLLAEAMWDPIKLTAKIALGIALAIKLLANGCLWCLRRAGVGEAPERKAYQPKKDLKKRVRKAADGGDAAPAEEDKDVDDKKEK